MKEYIKIKSENNDEFIKVHTYYYKERQGLILTVKHVKRTFIEASNLFYESFCPTNSIVIKVADMQRDNKKFVETFKPENLNVYIERICTENNLIIE